MLEVLLRCKGDRMWNLPPSKRKRPKDVADDLDWPTWKVYAAAKQLRKHGYLVRSRRHKPYVVTEYGIRAMKRHQERLFNTGERQ